MIIVVGARAGVASCMAGTEVQATARTAVISLGRRTLLSEFVRELLAEEVANQLVAAQGSTDNDWALRRTTVPASNCCPDCKTASLV